MERREQLRSKLKSFFGFDEFKGHQQEIVENILRGRDSFVLMPTGGGKSLCYQLPALLMEGTAVVISPLIALMKNQVDAIRRHSDSPAIAHFINSSLSKSAIDQVKKDLLRGATKLLYVSPESLTKQENIDFLRSIEVSFYAIDEAQCISEWGHDFRPEYRRIREIVNEINRRPMIALTATATPIVLIDIQKNLGMVEADLFSSSFNRPNLYYEVREKGNDIDHEIVRYIRAHPGKAGIIYCMSRTKVNELTDLLQRSGIKASAYHAGLDATLRTETQDAFINEQIHVIVATIAFGMGIDKPDVRFVIHYDIPKSIEGYYQETGRAGRDGGEGVCIAFYNTKDYEKLDKFLNSKNKQNNERKIGRQLLSEMAGYANAQVCRRKYLLHYFGEIFPGDNCHNCDNCKNRTKKVEAKEILQNVLEGIAALKEKGTAEYVTNFLMGSNPTEAEAFGHDSLEEFGSCQESSEELLTCVIEEAIVKGYIDKNLEQGGELKISKKGKAFLKKPCSFVVMLRDEEEDEDPEDMPEDVKGGASSPTDPALFKILQDLRKKEAKKHNLSPSALFEDQTLMDMTTLYPITLAELQEISGVGESKAQKYGEAFVTLIGKYVRENEIDRPGGFPVKVPPSKSKLRSSVIHQIDRRIPLNEIAGYLDLEFDELLTEIEVIVMNGTEIDLNYFINEAVEEDVIDDILDYFEEADNADLNEALDALGDKYEEVDIRLVRVKFLTDKKQR